MRSVLSKVFMIALGLAIGLSIVEFGLRSFSPVELRLMGTEIRLPHFRNYVVTVENPRVLEPRTLHTKNSLGFRGPDVPRSFDDTLSIIAIGGSTTECYVLADGKDWPAVLQQELSRNFSDVWINNAGQNGHTTLGHIRMMKQHVAKLKPKVVLFLTGVNDTSFEDNHARFDAKLDPASEDDFLYRIRTGGIKWLSQHSHAVALLFQTYRQLRASQVHDLGGGLEKDFAAMASQAPSHEDVMKWRAELAERNFNGYLDRVEQLVSISRANGIEPVFITQPVLAGPGKDPETGLSLERLVKAQIVKNQLLNEKLIEFGQQADVLVIDAHARMPRTSRHFYDLWHYTNAGSQALADIVYGQLCPYLARKFPDKTMSPCTKGDVSTAAN